MNITALMTSGQKTRAVQRQYPLARVMIWELRRFSASRIFWLEALGFFALLLPVMWGLRAPEHFGTGPDINAGELIVAGTSAWGLLDTLPICLVLLVVLLPFITADGVTRDVQRRTSELVMATPLPVRAYVWGRYLVGLMLGFGLALLMAAAIVGMGVMLHLTVPGYPWPSISALVLLWIGMVLPATMLVTSIGFAIATLQPRLSTLIKVVILVAWIVGAVIIPSSLRNGIPPSWYVNWDPTSAITGQGLVLQYSLDDLFRTATSEVQFQNGFLPIENRMPSIGTWFGSHLLIAGFSLVVVLVVSLLFKRSRDVHT
jgi:ABC-type transport system involved in multi-copper enzyme maturation permease subunit